MDRSRPPHLTWAPDRHTAVPRVLLINPPSPEQLGAPLLGLQYVTAALLERGCEVRVIDAGARYFDHDHGWIVAEADSFRPDMIGFGLFTRWVWHAYQLADAFRGCDALLVAGGAHTTVRPDEVIEHGFDVAVIGEAERTIVGIVDHLAHTQPMQEETPAPHQSHDLGQSRLIQLVRLAITTQ